MIINDLLQVTAHLDGLLHITHDLKLEINEDNDMAIFFALSDVNNTRPLFALDIGQDLAQFVTSAINEANKAINDEDAAAESDTLTPIIF